MTVRLKAWLRCAVSLVVLGAAMTTGAMRGDAVAGPWAIAPTSNPTPTNELHGVSCVSATFCIAVGVQVPTPSTLAALIEVSDGTTWSVMPSVNPSDDSRLTAVSCTSQTRCVAVGFSISGTTTLTLVESWDGTAWTVTPSPSPGMLEAVSCASTDSCVAVGQTGQGTTSMPLIEAWDGTEWTVSPSAKHGPPGSLGGVSCVAPTRCVAVGYRTDYGPRSLIEQWNGRHWSVIPSPIVGAANDELRGVSCTSVRSCVAVGQADRLVNLIDTWDGSTWSGREGGFRGLFAGTSCATRNRCVAVGYSVTDRSNGSLHIKALIESSRPAGWAPMKTANPGPGQVQLTAVSCATGSCTAVGFIAKGQTTEHTLALVNQ